VAVAVESCGCNGVDVVIAWGAAFGDIFGLTVRRVVRTQKGLNGSRGEMGVGVKGGCVRL
jgi:hypothetical protein